MSDDRTKELKDFIVSTLKEEGILKKDIEPDKIEKALFQTPSSLRLRKPGYVLMKAVYDHEKFPLEDKLTGRELMTLKNYVSWPYFLPVDHSYIVLFTIKESFFLKLQGGDVKKWLAQIHEKNSK